MKKIELLAPAGSFEKAKTAFKYGADAVYCGTSSLSLRTRADMDNNDLIKTIEYAHSIGKRVHVTLNIFAWDDKYEEIIEMAKILNEVKPDAIGYIFFSKSKRYVTGQQAREIDPVSYTHLRAHET